MQQLYFTIPLYGFGVLSLVASLICFFAYSFANDFETKRLAYPWIIRLLLLAFMLLTAGVLMTLRVF